MPRLTEKNPFPDFTLLQYTPKEPIYLDYEKGDTEYETPLC